MIGGQKCRQGEMLDEICAKHNTTLRPMCVSPLSYLHFFLQLLSGAPVFRLARPQQGGSI